MAVAKEILETGTDVLVDSYLDVRIKGDWFDFEGTEGSGQRGGENMHGRKRTYSSILDANKGSCFPLPG